MQLAEPASQGELKNFHCSNSSTGSFRLKYYQHRRKVISVYAFSNFTYLRSLQLRILLLSLFLYIASISLLHLFLPQFFENFHNILSTFRFSLPYLHTHSLYLFHVYICVLLYSMLFNYSLYVLTLHSTSIQKKKNIKCSKNTENCY